MQKVQIIVFNQRVTDAFHRHNGEKNWNSTWNNTTVFFSHFQDTLLCTMVVYLFLSPLLMEKKKKKVFIPKMSSIDPKGLMGHLCHRHF